jgi:hypothetical protein
VELDSVDERVLVDRASVCGAPAQRLAVGVATFPTEAADSDRLLALADADVRRNKQVLRPRERTAEPSTETAGIQAPLVGLALGEPTGQPVLWASAGTG